MIFQATNKFVVVFVGLIFGKMEVDEMTGPQLEIDVIYKFDFELIIKVSGWKQRILQPFLSDLSSIKKTFNWFCQVYISKSRGRRIYWAAAVKWCQI